MDMMDKKHASLIKSSKPGLFQYLSDFRMDDLAITLCPKVPCKKNPEDRVYRGSSYRGVSYNGTGIQIYFVFKKGKYYVCRCLTELEAAKKYDFFAMRYRHNRVSSYI
jgi:hypothetical protein